MHHAVSYLFHPVNALLVALFGQPPEWWTKAMEIEGGSVWLPDHVLMSFLVVLIVWALLVVARRQFSLERPGAVQQLLEVLLGGLRNMCEDVIGHGLGKPFVPFIAAQTLFIFLANLFGLVFFLQPPTANTSTTFALSITAFLFYNIVGITRVGPISYAKQFVGPVWWLFPLMVPVEIISHLARVLSLAVRLFGNIFGEHTASGIFFSLVPLAVPLAMMALGVIGATIQTFIFIMLTAVYIGGAVAHEH